MSKRIIAFTVLVAGFALWSCNGNENQAEIARLTHLQSRLDSCARVIDSLDLERIGKLSSEIATALESIQKIVAENEDTMDKHTAIFLSQYYAINKGLNRFSKNHKKLIKEMDYTAKQLTDLTADVYESKLKLDKMATFIQAEEEAVLMCVLKTTELVSGIKFALRNYDENSEKVEEILQSYAERAKPSGTEANS